MSSFLDKGNSIIYGAALDKFTGRYVPTGQLLGHAAKGKCGMQPFTLSGPFFTASEAKAAAAAEAISWAERRLVGREP